MLWSLTEEEAEFLRHHEGTVIDFLSSIGGEGRDTPKDQAARAVDEILLLMEMAYPSRTEHLLVLATLTRKVTMARDSLLDALIRENTNWSQLPEMPGRPAGTWGGSALADHEINHLASLADLHPSTIRSRYRKIREETLAEARKNA